LAIWYAVSGYMGTTSADALQPLRYPVGRFKPPAQIISEQRTAWIGEIEELPEALAHAVKDLSESQLDTPYREGGWTIRQVVHHVPDSHLNSYIRFRLALTEDVPTIKPYAEAAWAELADAKRGPVEPSLELLRALHRRWLALLKSLDDAAWARTFRHPERGESKLDWNLGLYAWHGRHHLAQITSLRERQGWG
jgi:uncharacterized damage-inducible protein DinB